MSVYYDEIEIEDFEYDEELDLYFYPCPCGDRFEITKVIKKAEKSYFFIILIECIVTCKSTLYRHFNSEKPINIYDLNFSRKN